MRSVRAVIIATVTACCVGNGARSVSVTTSKAPASAPGPTPSTSLERPTEKLPRAYATFMHTRAGNRPPFDEPNAWAYVPTRFDPEQRLKLVVFFHGFHNCLRSFVADVGVSCRRFQSPRTAYGIAAQMERAKLGSIAVVPQLAFDRDSSDALSLAQPGAARALLKEIVETQLRDQIGPHTLDDVSEVTFVAASGGHEALVPVLAHGDVPNVHRVILMDAYYAASIALDAFVMQNLDEFGPQRRLAVVYTDGKPTLTPTLDFVARITERLRMRGSLGQLRHVAKSHEVVVDDFKAPIAFVHSALGHDDVMRFDLWKALATVAG